VDKQQQGHIFISHSPQDSPEIQALIDGLERANFQVWSEDSLRAGEDWSLALHKAMNEAGKVVVAVTPHAKLSSWLEDEFNTATRLNKDIIAVVMPTTTLDAVPSFLSDKPTVDLREQQPAWDNLFKLLSE